MSELQVSLLVIGSIVVAGVFLYGQWQQWRYRRSLGAIRQEEGDSPSRSAPGATPEKAEPEVLVSLPTSADAADDICGLLNDATDYVVTFLLVNPSTTAVLDALWQRRFDFGKSVNACGLNTQSGLWERLIPESPQTYRAFRIGLQLVDRSGSVSEMRLQGFQELLAEIAAQLRIEVRLPSVAEALQRAVHLDRFCADVDQMIGINLMTGGDRRLFGTEVAGATERMGMSLQGDGTYHLLDDMGETLYTLSATDGSVFQHHTLNQTRVDSLTLLLDIPRVKEPVRRFDEMVSIAAELAGSLRLTLVDDQRVALGEGAIAQIRASVAATEDIMLTGHITPGSPQALRLFS